VPPKPTNVLAAPAADRLRKVSGGGQEPAGGKWQAAGPGTKKKLRSQAVATPPAEPTNRPQGAPKRPQPRPHGKATVAEATAAAKTLPPAPSFRQMMEDAKAQRAAATATKPATHQNAFSALLEEVQASKPPAESAAMDVEEPAAGPSTGPANVLAPPTDPSAPAEGEGPLELPEFPVVSDEEEDIRGLPDLPEASDDDT
jgi:hypothetical protein